jgi:hypothetical protein
MTLSTGPNPSVLYLYSIALGAVIAIFYITYILVASRILHLKDIPGPWWAPYTRLWLFKTLASEKSHKRYVEVNDQYGQSTISWVLVCLLLHCPHFFYASRG